MEGANAIEKVSSGLEETAATKPGDCVTIAAPACAQTGQTWEPAGPAPKSAQ